MKSKRVVLIGIDSLIPKFVSRFTREGIMPNLKSIIEKGFSSEMFPVVPPLTGPGWATIATGCWPSTHGAEGHFVHRGGDPLDKRINGYSSGVLKVKTIWEKAEEQGKKTILIKYPGSWPPQNIGDRLQVGGGGGFAEQDCPLQIYHSRCFTTDRKIKDSFAWVSTPVQHISFQKEVRNKAKLYDSKIIIHPRGIAEMSCIPREYQVQVNAENCLLTISKENGEQICQLKEKQWSDWIWENFESLDQKQLKGYFKFKLINCREENGQIYFKLYMTQVHDSENYTVPKTLAGILNEKVGPFVEHTDIHDYYANWMDGETLLEIWDEHTRYMKRLFSYLVDHNQWDLIYLQYHPIDYVLHGFMGGIDERHFDYRKDKAEYYWNFIRKTHQLADDLIGHIINQCENDDTIIVVGDHGHALWKNSFLINKFLYQKGYLNLEFDQQGRPAINWGKTRAFATGVDFGAGQIYFNLRGRDPEGIVEVGSSEYSKLQETITKQLYELKAPNGNSTTSVKFVMKKDELDAFGLRGDGIGELLIFQKTGYENQARLPQKEESEGPLFEKRTLGDFHTSEHGTFFPFDKDMRTFLAMRGPDIVKGISSPIPYQLVDVAPTVAVVAGIQLSSKTEGRIIDKVFD